MCSRWLLFAVVQEVGYGRHCLAESCGLSGNGDEKVGGSGIYMIAQRVVEALQPLCQFGSMGCSDCNALSSARPTDTNGLRFS